MLSLISTHELSSHLLPELLLQCLLYLGHGSENGASDKIFMISLLLGSLVWMRAVPNLGVRFFGSLVIHKVVILPNLMASDDYNCLVELSFLFTVTETVFDLINHLRKRIGLLVEYAFVSC